MEVVRVLARCGKTVPVSTRRVEVSQPLSCRRSSDVSDSIHSPLHRWCSRKSLDRQTVLQLIDILPR